MPFRGGLLLDLVTTGASNGLFSGVRLVAADATRVAWFDQPGFVFMAVIAADLVLLGVVRQPFVATRARLVPFVRGRLLHARLMAALTRSDVAQCKLETVWLMAPSASGGAVRTMVGRS